MKPAAFRVAVDGGKHHILLNGKRGDHGFSSPVLTDKRHSLSDRFRRGRADRGLSVDRDLAACQLSRSVNAFQEFCPPTSAEPEHSGDQPGLYFQIDTADDSVPGADPVDFQSCFSDLSVGTCSQQLSSLNIRLFCFTAHCLLYSAFTRCLICRSTLKLRLSILSSFSDAIRDFISAHQPYQLFSAGSCRIHRGHPRSVS